MIKTSTLNFLKDLRQNNNREWFQLHKGDHDAGKEDVLGFIGRLISELVKTDTLIPPSLQPKDCLMRIYRDVRFSKDKTPYKTNFGIAVSPNGKNFNGPGYYLHIEPGKSFIAAGCWMPETDQLKSIRQEIDYNPEEFRSIIEKKSFIANFVGLDAEDKLKTAPKGYSTDHPDIELLKLKSFTASKKLTNKELIAHNSEKNVAAYFAELYPFIVFLRNAIHN